MKLPGSSKEILVVALSFPIATVLWQMVSQRENPLVIFLVFAVFMAGLIKILESSSQSS